jgi:ATP/maltotriose-dependent transcriptional regulator MalT
VERAQQLGAVEEAAAHLERALDLWSPEDGSAMQAELLLACGQVRARLLRGDVRAVDLLERAHDLHRELGDEAMAARSLGALANARWEVGDREGALGAWEGAVPELRRLGARDALLSALATWAHALAGVKRPEAAERLADEGLALVPEAVTPGEAVDRVSLLTTKGMVTLWRCDVATAEPLYREAARLAEQHHDDVGAARVLHSRGAANTLLVRLPEMRQSFDRAAELVARHGLRRLQAFYLGWGAKAAVEAGDWAGARRRGDEAAALLDPNEAAELIRFMIADGRAETLLGVGELEEALGAYEALLDTPFPRSDQRYEEAVREDTARVHLLAGDTAAALAALGPAVEPYVANIARGDAEVETAWTKVTVLAAGGATAEAAGIQAWAAALLPGHPFTDACAALLAIPAGPAAGAVALEDAARGMEADGWLLYAVGQRVAGATIAARAEDGREPAVALLRTALDRFRALGSEPMCRRLEARLRTLGERAPTGRGKAGAGGLSARELEVLVLVAEGMTNRQIADALVLSPNTVIRHVANIFAKLDAGNRAAAVAIATERGLMAKDGKPLS